MGSIDSAFIKAFAQSRPPREATRAAREASGVKATSNVIVVDAAANGFHAMSEIYASASLARPLSVATAVAKDIQLPAAGRDLWSRSFRHEFAHHATSPPHIATPRPQPKASESTQMVTEHGTLRVDQGVPAHPLVPTPEELSDWSTRKAAESPANNEDPQASMRAEARTIACRAESTVIPQQTNLNAEVSPSKSADHPITTSEKQAHAFESRPNGQPTWFPQWEVDRFRWPKVCQSLSEQATTELAEVVRPLLNSAWRGKNVVAVTSFDRDAGGTTVSLCMAKMAASFRVPVAVIDGDHEHAGLGTALGIAFDHGWNDLSGGTALNEVAIASLHDRLVAVPINLRGAGSKANAAEAIAMIEELAANFELVLVDAGPIYSAAHLWFTSPLAMRINSAIIVRNLHETTDRQISDVSTRLKASGIESLAVVENFATGDSLD